MDMSVEISGDFLEFIKTAPERLQEAIETGLRLAVAWVEGEVKKNIPAGATGNLRNSIVGEVRGNEGIVGSSAPYAASVEYGAKPHMPPVEALILWVKRKLGVTDDEEAVEVAWRIAWSMRKHGTIRYTTKDPGAFALAFEQQAEIMEKFRWAVDRFIAGAND